jgi:formate hydrogenlyase subunit 3/multisubunit Na+/H+ antiporter MnhD subunit
MERMRISSTARPYVWALGLLWLLPAVAVAVGYIVLPDEPPGGQCEGIGFGCVPAPNDTVLILGMLAAPFLLLSGIVAIAIISWVRYRRREERPRRGRETLRY